MLKQLATTITVGGFTEREIEVAIIDRYDEVIKRQEFADNGILKTTTYECYNVTQKL